MKIGVKKLKTGDIKNKYKGIRNLIYRRKQLFVLNPLFAVDKCGSISKLIVSLSNTYKSLDDFYLARYIYKWK